MADEVIEYKGKLNNCEWVTTNGLKWYCYFGDNKINLKFDWSDLKEQGVEGVKGYVMLRGSKIGVEVKKLNEYMSLPFIRTTVNTIELNLTFIKSPFFAKSENSDAILLVEDTKLHVNKAFLSYHSEFFRGLFEFESEEKQKNEYKIDDVSADDMKALLAIIHPENEFPTDENAEKLLELADRFMIPSVTRSVEFYLLKVSKIDNAKKMWLADKFQLNQLMIHAISAIESTDIAREVRTSHFFKQMSIEVTQKVLDKVLQLTTRS